MFVFEKLTEQEILSFIVTNKERIQKAAPGITISDENILLIAKLAN
ncbi:MAG: hypothetical protein WCG98_04430 [bacterium]